MSTHTVLRWGLLSTAHINRAVIPPIRSSNRSQLLAVASRSEVKASQYALAWGIPRFHSSYDALLADPEIDVIYNSLPNSLHAEWSFKAMQMGKHVLCEKPLATSSQDVDKMIKTSTETGKVLAEAFMFRHHPQTLLVKDMVANGGIGDLHLIRGSFRYFNTRAGDTRFDPHLGGGSLWDIGCYPISFACYLVGGEPVEVYGSQLIGPTGIDLLFAGQMVFPGGMLAQFDSSFISPHKVEMEITGEKGSITIPEPFKPGINNVIHLQQNNRTKTIRVKGLELYKGEINDMEDAILDGKPTRISLQESKAMVEVIEALYHSAMDHKPLLTKLASNTIQEN